MYVDIQLKVDMSVDIRIKEKEDYLSYIKTPNAKLLISRRLFFLLQI